MPDLVFKDQSADELWLNLVQGVVDLSELTILCQGEVNAGDITVNSGIVGASHFLEISVRGQGVVFTEVFACIQSVDILTGKSIFSNSLENAKSCSVNGFGCNYNFISKKTNWEQGAQEMREIQQIIDNGTLSDRIFGQVYKFPSSEEMKFPPTTIVCVIAQDNGFVVRTVHAYPTCDELVFTKTTINKEKVDD